MPFYRNTVVAWALCWIVSSLALMAMPSALIVIGTTGSPSVTGELAGAAQDIHDGLIQRGFKPGDVEILQAQSPDDRVTTDRVLQSLKKRQALAATDEFWLILLGFSGRTDDDIPAFQVSGPRLTVNDLKTALDAIPARQFVFIGTSDSGGFVPVLLTKSRSILAATREEGEIDLPRFPESWAAALNEKPQSNWNRIAARAAELNDKYYTDSSLAEGEHARLGDPATGAVLEAPFGVDSLATAAEKPPADDSMAAINASDIKVEIHKPNSEWEKQAATEETKKLIAEARAVPNPEGFNSLLLEQRLGYRIGEDRTAEDFVLKRIYIAKEDGVARWANFMLPQDPPAVTTKLEAARIIQPDGSSTVFNPAKLPPPTDDSGGMSGAISTVFIPDAHAGCLIEIAWHTQHILDASVPDFSEELAVQQDIPVMKTGLQLLIPAKTGLHFKLRNSDQKPVETGANGMRVLTWDIGELAAYEELPYDPPAHDFVTELDVTSLDSWDAFATWYRRLTRGSDEQDADVKAKAEELAAGANTRMDKIRRAFEFVSALRYVAIEFGINGIRPRTPAVVLQNRYGDCKDKANLLIALLTDMGIDARFCLLNRGSSTDVSFPSWQFNHAIACVPKAPDAGQLDDLFLDTTDSTAPFPTLSPGDIGRNALVFGKDSAQFMTVAAAGKDATEIEEHWEFGAMNGNSYRGTVQTTWTGLAEYDVRSSVRGRSPAQRDFVLQMELSRELRDADFTNLNLTAADDFSIPMRLDAQIVTPSNLRPIPLPGFDVDAYFAAPQRNRPLLINNGQKLHLIQTVEWRETDEVKDHQPFTMQVAGIHATIAWRQDNQSLIRTAELTIDQPLVAPSDYVPMRKMLRNWMDRLTL